MVRCGSKNGHQKDNVFKRDWTTCSKFVNHSRLNSQHNWGDLYDHLMSKRIFTLIIIEDIHMSSKNYEENGYSHDLDLLIISH